MPILCRPWQRLALGVAVVACFSAVGVVRAADDAAQQSVPTTTQDQGQQKSQALEEVVVTGSHIARSDLERLEPTTEISSAMLQERSYTNVVDALSELPQFGQPDNSLVGGQSAFGVGQSFANFFSLGSNRTLTLVDGLRFVPENSPSIFGATGNGGEQVDLNVIPTELIDHIETIAVGGAPIYGSDAIAGTVNIILKHNYEGFTGDIQGGISGQGDTDQSRIRLLAGKNFFDDRGNITVSVEDARLGGLLASDRSRYTADMAYLPASSGPYAEQLIDNERIGSITPEGVPMLADGYLNFNPNYAITNSAGQTLAFSNGQLAPYTLGPPDPTGVYNIGGDGLDFAQITTLQSGQDRFNATVFASFQVNDYIRAFAELWDSDTHTSFPEDQGEYDTALFAPAGQVSGNLILSVHNPFLSAADQATIAQDLAAFAAVPGNPTQTSDFYLARVNQDVGDGGSWADQVTRRYVAGIDGSIPIPGHDVKYSVSMEYGTSSNLGVTPSINFQNFLNALDAVPGPNGTIVCAPGYTNSKVPTFSSACAPFNPFGNGIASPAAFDYITDDATADSLLTQRDIVVTMNGNLFSLPAGQLKAALGYENRLESADFQPDQFFQQAAGYDIPIDPLSGSFLTNEVFGELLAPVFSPEFALPAVHRLELEGAIREVDHSVAGKALTWTAGLRWEPVSILQFRGNYTRAIRAPSVTEAFLPTSEAFDTAQDPCDHTLINSGPDPATRAKNCAAAGIVQPFTSNILSFTEPITVSGDPNLQNEIADSRTYGFVLRPTRNLTWSADWVSIDIENAIVTLDATNVLDACYDSPTYPNEYCSKITRSSSGQITLVQTGYANAGYEDFSGVTSELDYSTDLPAGLGALDLTLNYFFENHLDQAVGEEDVVTLPGSIGNSKHRATLDLTWTKDKLLVLWQTRFIGHAIWDNSLPSTNTQIQGVPNWWLNNVTLGYNPTSHLKFQLVIDNVFNKEAPFPLPAAPQDSTLAIPNAIETYYSGILGRYFIGSVYYTL